MVKTVNMQKHLDMLGHNYKDVVTGISGIICSVSFDLFGCIMADLRPQGVKDDGELKSGYWFDVNRLRKLSEERVMEPPNFEIGAVAEGKKGACSKDSTYA